MNKRTLIFFLMYALVFPALFLETLQACDSKNTLDKDEVSALELSQRLTSYYSNFVSIVEVAFGRASEGVTDVDKLRVLTLVKLRMSRACRAAAFQIDPRNSLIDTWGLCVQFRLYINGDGPVRELGLNDQALPILRNAAARMESDIVMIATQYFPEDSIRTVAVELERFAKEHPLSSVHTIAQTPQIEASSANTLSTGIGKLLSLPLAPFRAMDGVDHTAQAVTEFARVVDSVDRTALNLPREAAWESELLILDVRRDLDVLLDQKIEKVNASFNATLRANLDMLMLRALAIAAAVFVLAILYHFITRRWFPAHEPSRKTS